MTTELRSPPSIAGPHLKLSLLLGAACALAALALFPYLLVLMPQKLAGSSLPLWGLALLQAIQAGLLCWLCAWAGLVLGARHGLDAPWLRAWVYHRPVRDGANACWWLAALLGVLSAMVVLGLSLLGPHAADAAAKGRALDWAWRGALASFYGATVEEVQARLLVVSLLMWLLARLCRGHARTWMFAAAIVGAALLFGAGHLPAAAAAGLAASPLAMARIVALNAVAGLLFGWLFWRRGLEHAMLAHFCADLVLHVAWPLLELA